MLGSTKQPHARESQPMGRSSRTHSLLHHGLDIGWFLFDSVLGIVYPDSRKQPWLNSASLSLSLRVLCPLLSWN